MHAVAPHLQNLEQQNADLRQRLAVEARHPFDQRVERAVPNYREIDRNPRWHRWLRYYHLILRDVPVLNRRLSAATPTG